MVKKYQIIYADPPWQYSFSGTRKVKNDDYQTPKADFLYSLDVASISDKNCALFMWVIFNRLQEALNVISSWGFTYKSCAFTWVKRNSNSMGWFWGMGGWTRANAELCLIATKGKPKRESAGIHSIVDTPIMKHSRKPDEVVRDRIVALCGDLPRIELFARRKVEGWDCWGNEVESDIEL